MMSRFADNCGWATPSRRNPGGWTCVKRKWEILPADKGCGLCPCNFWVKIMPLKVEKKTKKADFPPKTLF